MSDKPADATHVENPSPREPYAGETKFGQYGSGRPDLHPPTGGKPEKPAANNNWLYAAGAGALALIFALVGNAGIFIGGLIAAGLGFGTYALLNHVNPPAPTPQTNAGVQASAGAGAKKTPEQGCEQSHVPPSPSDPLPELSKEAVKLPNGLSYDGKDLKSGTTVPAQPAPTTQPAAPDLQTPSM